MKEEHTCETCNLVYADHLGKRRCALDDCDVYPDGSCAEWEGLEENPHLTTEVPASRAPSPEIKQIADHYSLTNQLHQTNEELAELIQAICKLERNWKLDDGLTAEIRMSDEYVHLEEEFADVAVMMEQLQYKLDFGSVIHDLMLAKMARQCRRIEEGTE